jgi:nucleoside recognition membrane protein YjiH
MKLMNYAAIGTWIAIALGFLVNPMFFVIGLALFVVAAIMWTAQAFEQGVNPHQILTVWAIPLGMMFVLGFAVMFLPTLPSEKED